MTVRLVYMFLSSSLAAWTTGSWLSGQQPPPATDPVAAMRCVQNALGGAQAIEAISSLTIVAGIRPAPAAKPAPIPGRRQIDIVLPDRYRRTTSLWIPPRAHSAVESGSTAP